MFPTRTSSIPSAKTPAITSRSGTGLHLRLGAHLARAEGRVTVNRLLDLTTDIRISEKVHGPADDRHYDYLPTFFLRGLRSLTVEYAT